MSESKKDLIRKLLKGIETGDAASVAVVNEERYIQHNPQTHEGSEGLAALFQRLSKTNPRVNVVRAFEDGDFVFAHTEYDFDTSRVGFEVFRFENGQAVEHWDNIQPRHGPNASGHSMVDGPVAASDLDLTEPNRQRVADFVEQVLIERRLERLDQFVSTSGYTQHNPHSSDGIGALRSALAATDGDSLMIQYELMHRILAEGSFVLTVCEGFLGGVHTSFYDLFRLDQGLLVEHWDTIETVPPRSQWKNDNGKF